MRNRTKNRATLLLDAYCRWLSRHYFVVGMDAEDVFQEAMLAAWLADPGYEERKARQRVYDLMKIGQRRRFEQLGDIPVEAPDVDWEARERLREILSLPRTANEVKALARRIAGIPIGRSEHALDMAWYRLRARATLAA